MMDSDTPEIPNPRAKANIFSALTYFWTLPILKTAFGRDLETSDLYSPLNEHTSGKLGDTFSQYWKNELVSGKPSFSNVIFNSFKWRIILYFILTLIVDSGLRLLQCVILAKFIKYFSKNPTDEASGLLFISLWGSALIFCSFITILISHAVITGMYHLALKAKIGCSSLIYRKSLRLSKSSLNERTTDTVFTLLNRDVTNVESFIKTMNYLIIAPSQLIIFTSFLWCCMGVSSLVGVGIFLFTIPFTIWLGHINTNCSKEASMQTEERIKKTSEVISGIKLAKMLASEQMFFNTINHIRNKEIEEISKKQYMNGTLLASDILLARLALFVSLVSYISLGNQVTAAKVFVVLCIYNMLKQSLTLLFSKAIIRLADFNTSLNNIQSFMLYEESNKPVVDGYTRRQFPTAVKYESIDISIDELTVPLHTGDNIKEIKFNVSRDNLVDGNNFDEVGIQLDNLNFKKENALCLEQVFAKLNTTSKEFVISNVSLTLKYGSFAAIIGDSGSGKSSLLNVILEELPIRSGIIDVFADMSYASQEPWLFNGTIKKNILLGSKLDKMRYKNVIECCSLKHDMVTLNQGDKFIVLDFGGNLNEGQRSKINLARAVYRNVDIYLLDEPLKSADAHVGQQLFDNCLKEFLSGRTRLVVMSQMQHLNDVDHIIMMQNGSIIAEGTYDYLQENSKEFRSFVTTECEKMMSDVNYAKVMRRRQQEKLMVRMSSDVYNDSIDDLPNHGKHKLENSGVVESYVYKAYFMASGSVFFIIGVLFLAFITQILASFTDWWISYWINTEEKYTEYCQTFPEKIDELSASNVTSHNGFDSSDSNSTNFMMNDQGPNLNNSSHADFCCEEMSHVKFLQMYGVFLVTLLVIVLLRSFSFFSTLIRSSLNLHYNMLDSIIKAQIRFFTLNSSGRILNRFSKDIETIDNELPSKLGISLQNILQLLGTIILAVYINWWLVFMAMFSIGLFIIVRMYCIASYRSTQRLVGTTKSPGLSHLNASLKGITTIRAFGSQRQLEKEFDMLQNSHSSACYLHLTTGRAFSLWIDCICLLMIFITTWCFIISRDSSNSSGVGLVLTQMIGLLMMVEYGLKMSSYVENDMKAVERVLDYTDIELEPSNFEMQEYQLPETWPTNGEIKFNNVCVRYSPTRGPAVSDLDILIEGKHKIGVVGRTCSGKTSIINALFRLPFLDGYIEIDGVRTDALDLNVLRSNISIIPQEPILFSGTIKSFLDPNHLYSDNEIWSILEKVELKDKITEHGGIDAIVNESQEDLSVGHKLLLYLARALLDQNFILIVDETVADLDQRSDDVIQRIIDTEFKDCTVIHVTHRVERVVQCNKVLVMDGGRVVEYAHPYILLQNDSFFTSMVAKLGSDKDKLLRNKAAEHYDECFPQPPVKCA